MKDIEQENLNERDGQVEDLGLADLWYNLHDHRKLFGLVFIGFLLLAGFYAVFCKPVYKADTLIQVQKQQGSLLGALSDVASALDLNNAVEGELDVIASRTIVGTAIAKVHAETEVSVDNYFPILGRTYAEKHRLPANTLADPVLGLSGYAWGGERLALTKFQVPEELYKKKFYLTLDTSNHWTLRDWHDDILATGAIGQAKHFTVETDYGVKPAELDITGVRARPGTVFRLVQYSFQDTYEAITKDLKAVETTKDSSMIRVTYSSSNAESAASMVNEISDAYVAINVRNRSQQARLSLQFLQQKLPSIKEELDASEERLNTYRIHSKTIDIQLQTEALLTRAVDLTRQKTAVALSLEANMKLFKGGNPSIQALQSQINMLDAELSSIDKEVASLPSTQQDYLRLARDVAVNTQLYTALLANSQELEVAEAGTTGNVFVVDRAEAPSQPNWPKFPIILLVAAIVGLFAAFIFVQLLASLRNVIRDPMEIERISNVPLFSVVPSSKNQDTFARSREIVPRMLGALKSDDPSVEALRTLRSTLQFAVSGKGSNVVLFTGPAQGVGKSFISANFAYLLSLGHRKVLVIDADMRRSSLRNYFPDASSNGLAEVLAGIVPIEQSIRRDVFPNLDFLPAAKRMPPNPAELLDRPEFAELMKDLKTKYDYVIIDSPPVLAVSDSVTIARHSDLVFIVSRSNVSTGRQLRETVGRLETAGVQVTGHVFNCFVAARYGYGYANAYKYNASA
jgi:tyrosine-protein kinase Etk/Wzc